MSGAVEGATGTLTIESLRRLGQLPLGELTAADTNPVVQRIMGRPTEWGHDSVDPYESGVSGFGSSI